MVPQEVFDELTTMCRQLAKREPANLEEAKYLLREQNSLIQDLLRMAKPTNIEVPVNPDLDKFLSPVAEFQKMLEKGDDINGIRAFREKTGASLKEAKIVMNLIRTLNVKFKV